MIHHIVADVLSCDILIREIKTLYEAAHEGKSCTLQPLELQYGDFAVWQRKAFEKDEFKRRMNYWAAQLKPPIPVLDLPCDRPRPSIQTFKGAALSMTLSNDVRAAFSRILQGKTRHVLFCCFGSLCRRALLPDEPDGFVNWRSGYEPVDAPA